jgi:hypothetical protein
MTHTEVQVKVQTDLTTTFKIKQGLKQGDGLAPMLFNLALEYAIRKLPVDANGTLEFKMRQIVGYADDMCLLGRSLRSVKDMYQDLRINADEVELKINVSKTKAIFQTGIQNRVDQQLVIGDHRIEVVDSLVYLRSCITDDNNEYKDIQRRLMLANKAYFSLVAVMRSGDIHRKTK